MKFRRIVTHLFIDNFRDFPLIPSNCPRVSWIHAKRTYLFETIHSSAASLHNGCSIQKFDMTRYFQDTSTLRSQTEHVLYESDAEQRIYLQFRLTDSPSMWSVADWNHSGICYTRQMTCEILRIFFLYLSNTYSVIWWQPSITTPLLQYTELGT